MNETCECKLKTTNYSNAEERRTAKRSTARFVEISAYLCVKTNASGRLHVNIGHVSLRYQRIPIPDMNQSILQTAKGDMLIHTHTIMIDMINHITHVDVVTIVIDQVIVLGIAQNIIHHLKFTKENIVSTTRYEEH